jgi:hypothetical protein
LEPIPESVPDGAAATTPPASPAARARQALPPKGACWYCERPLDSVRRFCGKECADAFDEEKEFTR